MDEITTGVPPPPDTDALPPGDYIQPAFWAAICSGVLTGVPLLSEGFCLWLSGGGMLAVYFFKLMNGFVPRRTSDGARLGMLTGAFAFFVWLAVSMLANRLLHVGFWDFAMIASEHLRQSKPNDAQTREILDWMTSRDGLIVMYCFASLSVLVVNVLLAAIGAATAVRSANRPPEGN